MVSDYVGRMTTLAARHVSGAEEHIAPLRAALARLRKANNRGSSSAGYGQQGVGERHAGFPILQGGQVPHRLRRP